MTTSRPAAALRSRFSLTAITCCAMVCGTVLLAPVVEAARQDSGTGATAGDAAIVATIDLERVIDSLDAMKAANRDLAAAAERYQAKIQRMREQLELLYEETELLMGEQKDEKLAEAELLAGELGVETEFSRMKLEEMRVRVLRRIYEDVRNAAAIISQQNSWDLVLVNDALVEVPPVSNQQELMRQISARRVIYGDTRIDVTDILIDALNGAG